MKRLDQDVQPFPQATERLRKQLKTHILGDPAYRFWFLLRNDQPVLCLEITGVAWTLAGETYNLLETYKKNRRMWPLVMQAAGHLLP